MIRGLHGLLYSSDDEATRAFFRDKLRLPFSDVGHGWLIFDLPEGDLGVHPTDDDGGGVGKHDVSFYCDDIEGTVAELKARGVVFRDAIADHGYGLVTHLDVPGGLVVQLYEPRYTKSTQAKAKAKPAPKRARPKAKARPKAPVKAKAKAKAPPKKKAKPAPKKKRR